MRYIASKPHPHLELLKLPAPELEAITFDSLSEACCAMVLEKCVPDWKCEPGVTFQVPLQFNRYADFVVKHKVIEYHPIVFKHEFMDEKAYKLYKKLWYSIGCSQREDLDEMLGNEFLKQYYKRRKTLVQHNLNLTDKWLDICTTPREFSNVVAEISHYKADRVQDCWDKTWTWLTSKAA